jgi:uncharacterized protein YbjT (DUF2867 family)
VDSSFFEGKSVLITGASGLIGTGLIAALRSLRTRGMKVEITAHGFSPPSEVFHPVA